jgi:hypothetical protein
MCRMVEILLVVGPAHESEQRPMPALRRFE